MQYLGEETCQKDATLEDIVLNVRIVLKWILKVQVGALTGLLWHRIGTGGGAVVNVAMKVRNA
jgi:hypothetical protein